MIYSVERSASINTLVNSLRLLINAYQNNKRIKIGSMLLFYKNKNKYFGNISYYKKIHQFQIISKDAYSIPYLNSHFLSYKA